MVEILDIVSCVSGLVLGTGYAWRVGRDVKHEAEKYAYRENSSKRFDVQEGLARTLRIIIRLSIVGALIGFLWWIGAVKMNMLVISMTGSYTGYLVYALKVDRG